MYYVSFITEYPIYEPAEGGYYYAGEQVQQCFPCPTWKKANKLFRKLKDEFRDEYQYERGEIVEVDAGGCGRYINPGIHFFAHYIGEGARLEITRRRPVDRGYQPYC